MSVLSDVWTAYKSALTTAGFTYVSEGAEVGDTGNTEQKKFDLTLEGDESDPLQSLHGTSVKEWRFPLKLRLFWDPETRASTVWTGAADDIKTALEAMLKPSNRPSGCQLIEAGAMRITRNGTREIEWEQDFKVTARETMDWS